MVPSLRGKDTVLLNNESMTAAETVSAAWDVVGSDYATIRILFGKEPDTNGSVVTISLLESDDTVVSNHATFDSNFEATHDLVAAKEVRYEVDLRARKRFLRLTITSGTHTSGDKTEVSAVGTLTRNEQDPASTSDMGDDTVVIG